MGIQMSRGFCSVYDFKQLLEEESIDFSRLHTLELMCHPGDSGNQEYVIESEWLSGHFLDALKANWTLCNYQELAASMKR